MRNLSTVLSIVAIVLSGVLFYLHFSGKDSTKKNGAAVNKDTANFRIAYFDIDSLQANYDYFKDAFGQVRSKETSMNAELSDMTNRYQKRIRELQDKGATMSQSEGEAAQREFNMMQQRYADRKASLEQDLQKQQIDLMTAVRRSVEDYLKEYNKDKGYAFILSYEPGVMMYYRDSVYDITPDLVRGLNAKYKATKKP
ncbi:MAG: OmpH family outer membrane protein [Candidatus Pseudobacter hemicellulosilyticus]|uniref:OmpH family outer membrane protein n=1 Tax=Candidatus Pseudobacter hemicellulosilyticus TaxID=3121375 RepID=A0AAJ5WP38_9BACT|nr:MAG: OmpH family outer membrane protein [Pseudobacter sp.]